MEKMKWEEIIKQDLRCNIQKNNSFKPFNDAFDYNVIKQYKADSKPLSEEENVLFSLLPVFHNEYMKFYEYLILLPKYLMVRVLNLVIVAVKKLI